MLSFIMALSASHRLGVLAAATVLSTALVACSPPGEVDSSAKVDTASVVANAPSSAAAASTSASAAASATAATGAATISVKNADHIHDGDTLDVSVSGLDPVSGYYAAICAAGTAEGAVPACTGTMTDPQTAAWLKADGTGTVMLSPEGTAEFTLTATATGEAVDCTTQECVLKVFGDHANGFTPVAETPVEFYVH